MASFEAIRLAALALVVLLLYPGVDRADVPLGMRQIVKLHSFRFGIRFEKVVEFTTICGQVSVSEWRILLPDCVIDRVIVILLVDQH